MRILLARQWYNNGRWRPGEHEYDGREEVLPADTKVMEDGKWRPVFRGLLADVAKGVREQSPNQSPDAPVGGNPAVLLKSEPLHPTPGLAPEEQAREMAESIKSDKRKPYDLDLLPLKAELDKSGKKVDPEIKK